MHKWLFIQWSVNKFCSAYESILRRNQSGLTIDDKTIEAKKLYEEWDKDNKTFVLDHCWKILKGEDKWKMKMIELADIEKEKKASKNKQKNARPRDEGATHNDDTNKIAEIEAKSEESQPKKRSDGIKKVKANLKHGGSDACMEVLYKMMAKRDVLEKAKAERYMAALEVDKAALELEKKRVASEEKKAEAKLLKEEKEIMSMDLSSLSPTQRAWFEKKQQMIMEKIE